MPSCKERGVSTSYTTNQHGGTLKGICPDQSRTTPSGSAHVENLEGSPSVKSGSSSNDSANSPRSNVSSACLACKRRRIKCTGESPCAKCKLASMECVYAKSQDGRGRAVRDRGKVESEIHKKIVEGLFQAIQRGEDQHIIELIRRGASMSSVADAIDHDKNQQPHDALILYHSQALLAQRGQNIGDRSASGRMLLPKQEPPPIDSASSIHWSLDWTELTSLTATIPTAIDTGIQIDSSTDQFEDYLADRVYANHSAVEICTENSVQQMLMSDSFSSTPYSSSPVTDDAVSLRGLLLHEARLAASINPMSDCLPVECTTLFHGISHPSTNFLDSSTWACGIVGAYPELDIYFRLAWLVSLTRYMQWLIQPTDERYNLIPITMKPTSVQVSVPHPSYVDLAPIPCLRDRLIVQSCDYVKALHASGVTASWQGDLQEAVIRDSKTGRLAVAVEFEEHVRNLKDFTLGRSFLEYFPDLDGLATVTQEATIAPTKLRDLYPVIVESC